MATSLASGLGVGAITAFNFAFALLQLPIGVIGVPLGVIVFPSMARELAKGSVTDYVRLLTRALRLIVFVMVPIAGIAMVLRREFVTLLFGYGRFDDRAIDLTADTFLFFLIGLTAHAAIAIVARAFYARKDTRTPVIAALVAVATNSTLAILLVGPLGLSGLALAIAIGAWLEVAILLAILRRRVPELRLGRVGRVLIESSLATVAASAAALGTLQIGDLLVGLGPERLVVAAQAGLAGGVALGVYVGLAAVLRIPELASTIEVMRDIVLRRRPA